jgi:hypothetical protein
MRRSRERSSSSSSSSSSSDERVQTWDYARPALQIQPQVHGVSLIRVQHISSCTMLIGRCC